MVEPDASIPPSVLDAVATLIAWAGDDPGREGLRDTPARVSRAWREYCAGYTDDPSVHLTRVFEEVGGYDEIVLLKQIPFQSHCEHHMAPIIGHPRSPICRGTGWSESLSWRECCKVMPDDSRFRSG